MISIVFCFLVFSSQSIPVCLVLAQMPVPTVSYLHPVSNDVVLFNFMHRNIIEQKYPSIVESRRAAMTETDLTLIKQFSATNQNEYQVTSGQEYMFAEIWRMVLSILLSLFGIIITMMVGPIPFL